MKRIYCIIIAISFWTFLLSAQANWTIGSTSNGTILFNPEQGLPSSPVWFDIYVNIENSTFGTINSKLNINTKEGSFFAYQTMGNAFSPQNIFTLDIKGEAVTDTASFGINLRLSEGRHIRLNVKQGLIEDINAQTTLATGLLNNDLQNYRIVVDNNTAVLYNGFDYLAPLDMTPKDFIYDGGFETITSEEASAYWGHDSWTSISVVTNKKHSGNKSMRWDSGWTGRFMGAVKVQPNTSYKLTYWAEFEPQQSGWGFNQMSGGVYMDDVQIANLPIQGSGWREYTCNFTTGPATNEVTLYYHNGWNANGNFVIYFDDIVLERLSSEPFLQIGNIYPEKKSEINIGKISFMNGSAFKPVQTVDLSQLINIAETALAGTIQGTGVGQYPSYAITRFENIVNQANNTVSNHSSDVDSIDVYFVKLQEAIDLFNESIITSEDIVLESITASLDNSTIKKNEKARIFVTGVLSDNSEADLSIANIEYRSLNPDWLFVSAAGEITASAPGIGEVEVQVTLNTVTLKDTVELTVLEYVLSKISFEAYASKIEKGETTGTFYAVNMNDNTTPPSEIVSVIYRSIDENIAEVLPNGTILGKENGLAEIELAVTVFDVTLKDTVKVSVIKLESVDIISSMTEFNENDPGTYTLVALYSDGTSLALDNTNSLVWSDNRHIVKINDKGQLKADSAGTAAIELVVKRPFNTQKKSIELSVKKQATGLNLSKISNVTAYPSPFVGTLNIYSGAGISQVDLYDMSARKIATQTFSGETKQTLNLSEFDSGVFLLLVVDNEGFVNTLKVVKK